MFLHFFTLACFITGMLTGDAENDGCLNLFPPELYDADGVPDLDLQQLQVVCPKAIAFLECVEKQSPSIEGNPHLHSIFNGIRGVLNDLCETDSRLQKAYLANRHCFRNVKDKWPICYETSQGAYLKYRLFITDFEEDSGNPGKQPENDNEDEEERTEITLNEPYCLMNSYTMACLSMDILENCGREASDTFNEIIRRTKFLYDYCSNDEVGVLRSEFLDFLAYEEKHPQIEIFRNVFDFRR